MIGINTTISGNAHIPKRSYLKELIYSVNQKSSPPPETFCDIFTYGETV